MRVQEQPGLGGSAPSARRKHLFGSIRLVDMIPVLSSNVAAIGFDARTSTLFVRFHDGGRVYSYHGVPIAMYRAFLAAPSKGRFLAQFIKGFYAYARVA